MGDLPCKAKVILNGGNLSGFGAAIRDTAMHLSDDEVAKLSQGDAGYQIASLLATAEQATIDAQTLLLDTIEYKGPRPAYLTRPKKTL